MYQEAKLHYEQQGFCFSPIIYDEQSIAGAIKHQDLVISGRYETGVAPRSPFDSAEATRGKIVKIDSSHRADLTIREFVSNPNLGRWAAAITGAQAVQIWAVQLLVKPGLGANESKVGWHQDRNYWGPWEEDSELFTAWVPLTDVEEDCGPMVYIRGSHKWGFLNQGNFFDTTHGSFQNTIQIPDGSDFAAIPVLLNAGQVAFHHKLTFHGSHPNTSGRPRRSFAIHMRTERSWPKKGEESVYTADLTDHDMNPVIYGTELPF